MDQSYFQNAPNLFRTLYKSGMDNILDRTGQKFGISVTGIMGVKLLFILWKFMKETIHLPQF